MSKRKKYKPKPVNAVAVFKAIQGVQPISSDDKLYLFKQGIAAINRMQFGGATTSDFTVLCDALNVSTYLAVKGIQGQCLDELAIAKNAMQDAKQRYIKTNRLGFSAQELQAVKVALNIHNAQLELITYKEFTEAFEEQEKRLMRGEFYHRDGDLKINERDAA